MGESSTSLLQLGQTKGPGKEESSEVCGWLCVQRSWERGYGRSRQLQEKQWGTYMYMFSVHYPGLNCEEKQQEVAVVLRAGCWGRGSWAIAVCVCMCVS